MHCDLKPENILIESKEADAPLKIIDLGLGQFLNENEHLSRLKGSIFYMAPEQFKMKYNHKVDIWSCGVILYFLITGTPPFVAKKYNDEGLAVIDNQGVQKKILSGKVDYDVKALKHVDPAVVKMLKRMLAMDPDERPEAAELLNNQWFYSTNEDPIRSESKEEGRGLIGSFG